MTDDTQKNEGVGDYAAEVAFTLNTPSGSRDFPDEARWRVDGNGLLVIETGETGETGQGTTLTFSPAGWTFIEEESSTPQVWGFVQ